MIETIDIPRRRAALILFRSLKAAGYSDLLARQGVWSALWLEDRQVQSGYLFSGFLDHTRDFAYAQRGPAASGCRLPI